MRIGAFTAVVGAAVGLYSAGIGTVPIVQQLWPEPEPGLAFDLADGAAVERCVTVRGSGSPSEGEAVLVGLRNPENETWLYRADHVEGRWSVDLVIGGKDNAGVEFTLFVFSFDEELADYLVNARAITPAGVMEASHRGLPPGRRAETSVTVVRNSVGC